MSAPSSSTHPWRFFRAGGFDQVRLETGDDYAHLPQLDQKLWVALSCPTNGLELDPLTLQLLDRTHDGHIRAPDLIEAIEWLKLRLKTLEPLTCPDQAFPLEALRDDSDEGQRLFAAMQHILQQLNRQDVGTISLHDISDLSTRMAAMPFNGDGVLPPQSAQTPEQAALIRLIITHSGSTTDRSGETGITRQHASEFFSRLDHWHQWQHAPDTQPDLLPLGEQTATAYAVLSAVQDKIDDYFARCRLSAFDPRATAHLKGSDEQLAALSQHLLHQEDSEMAQLPLAEITANPVLALHGTFNPAWHQRITQWVMQVVSPLFGPLDQFSQADWESLKSRFQPYATWQSQQPSPALPEELVEQLDSLVAPQLRAALDELFSRDEALAPEFAALDDVDRLLHYVRDLPTLAHNFVSFSDFYGGKQRAIFQAGTLYLDSRSCDLCLRISSTDKHAPLASMAGIYLAYCDCVRGDEKITIAAAFTAGDSDQLSVGRNGVFYDRQGRDWTATITRLVDHPISLRQAFWMPYKKGVRLIGEQLQKIAASKAKQVDEELSKQATTLASKTVTPPTPTPASKAATPGTPFDVARFAGIFAAIGLAVGALGTAVASVITAFLALKLWQMPLAILGLLLMVSGPSVALAWFKLHNRNLGPLLDANGWAVNTRARINIPFGSALTQEATLPAGAERSLLDPYAEKKKPWKFYVFLLCCLFAAAAWHLR